MPSKKKTAKFTSRSPAKAHASSPGRSAALALEGRQAPRFELARGDGTMVKLDDLLRAGNLVLYFYPKDMTTGCTAEACSFRDNLSGVRALGAQIVGVSADSADSHAKFAGKYELNFPLLSDAGNQVGKRYGVYKMKSMYGRQYMGIERTTFVIDRKGVVRKVFPKVKVTGHTDAVVAALKEIA
ncbi:MAG TPA: thioredoxin-dependent thiol peroxidase [Candidatus Binataceae bacterium]|nr:thioredoxin-dependent thiol peroxidase [Candidatus Binataceae bacterium]